MKELIIDVQGAYPLRFEPGVSRCGTATGLSISERHPSYHGYAGGVIDADDVRLLRDWLTAWLESRHSPPRGPKEPPR